MQRSPSLPSLQVATPCPKMWDDLSGGEAKRFCEQCQKHVHNLSIVPRHEHDRLVRSVIAGQRICIAYQQNADGSLLRRPGWSKRWLLSAHSLLALFLPWITSQTQAQPPGKSNENSPGEHRGASAVDGQIILGKPATPATPAPSPTPPVKRGEAVVTMGQPLISPAPSPKKK